MKKAADKKGDKKMGTMDAALTKATGMDAAGRESWRLEIDALYAKRAMTKVGSAERKAIDAKIMMKVTGR